MNQFDAETFIFLLKDKFDAALSARIDAINAEKNPNAPTTITDFLVPKIKEWCMITLDEKVKSYPNFGFIYIDSLSAVPNGPVVGQQYNIDVVLIISNDHDKHIDRKCLRYMRALNESASNIWQDFQNRGVDFSFESLNPIDVKILNNSFFQKALGIRVSVTFN